MNLKPLYDRVVIDVNDQETTSKSGIVLPETSQERPQKGIIVAVGDGDTFEGQKKEMKVKIGDKVIFNKYAGTELKMDNKTYIILREIDIIGVEND